MYTSNKKRVLLYAPVLHDTTATATKTDIDDLWCTAASSRDKNNNIAEAIINHDPYHLVPVLLTL